MYKHSTTARPKLQGNLKQNFEAALVDLHEEDPRAVAHRTPIVQRRRGIDRTTETRAQTLTVAATALATLWGL
jgi:hypothetical protein